MIEVDVRCEDFKANVFYQDNANLENVRTRIISQMNNGHVVVLGEDRDILLSPKVIKSVQFRVVNERTQ